MHLISSCISVTKELDQTTLFLFSKKQSFDLKKTRTKKHVEGVHFVLVTESTVK